MHWDIASIDYAGDETLSYITFFILALFAILILFLLISHYVRIGALKGGFKRLYKELCTMHSREEFLGLVERKSRPNKLKYYSIDFIVISLLEIFQIMNQKNSLYLYRLGVNNLKKEVRDMFLENNRKILLASIVTAFGSFLGFESVTDYSWHGIQTFEPFVIAAAISFFSFLIYVSKIKYYYWLLDEIETLESIYKKFLDL